MRADEEFVKHAPAAQVKLLALLAVKYAALRQVKLSVPHIVPKAHFTREARFTRRSLASRSAPAEHLVERNRFCPVDKSGFFHGED